MLVLFELLVIELGISTQPSQSLYVKYNTWVTHSWLKLIWEKSDKFKVTIEVDPLPLQPPREQDTWFMQAIEDAGAFNEEEKRQINRFRCHQQVLFLSDIMDAGGREIDEKFLTRRPVEEQWSQLVFPIENPPRKHLSLWKTALHTIKSRQGLFLFKSFKAGEYCYDE
jgi:hypothetical protein